MNDEDDTEVRLALDDGLVHALNVDHASRTACWRDLTIHGATREACDAEWESWQTRAPVTCLTCLAGHSGVFTFSAVEQAVELEYDKATDTWKARAV